MEFADLLYQFITENGYSCHIQHGASWCETGRVVQIGTHYRSGIIHFYLKDDRVWMKGQMSNLEDPGRKVVAKIINNQPPKKFWSYAERGFTVPVGTIHEQGILEKVLYLIPDKYLKE